MGTLHPEEAEPVASGVGAIWRVLISGPRPFSEFHASVFPENNAQALAKSWTTCPSDL
jgi:hypothetical protein